MTGMEKIQQLLEENEYSIAQVNKIKSRLGDWIMCGGGPNDAYVWEQAKRLENLVKYGLVRSTSVQQNEEVHHYE